MTKEEFESKVKDLKAKHDAFLAALDEVLEARRYGIDDKIYLDEIEDMGNSNKLGVAADKLCQLRLWNPNR